MLIYCPICDSGFDAKKEVAEQERCQAICGNKVKNCGYEIGDVIKIKNFSTGSVSYGVIVQFKVNKINDRGKTKRSLEIGIRNITVGYVKAVQRGIISFKSKVKTPATDRSSEFWIKLDDKKNFRITKVKVRVAA